MRRNVSTSPKASSQPTPFSIADILSRRSSPSSPDLDIIPSSSSNSADQHKQKLTRLFAYHDSRLQHFLPDLAMAKELDLLRRNLALTASFSNLPHHAQTFADAQQQQQQQQQHSYHQQKEHQRQQDEALDMSKSKYLGERERER